MLLFLLVATECSGRSLATLLVAWVGAAMIASILLRWKYMWIVLAILTLLFLFVCGYTAYNAKRVHERCVTLRPGNDTTRHESNERAVVADTEISTVSGRMTDCEPITTTTMSTRELPSSNWQLAGDLPPSYASVIGETSSLSYSTLSLAQPPTATIAHTATSAIAIPSAHDEISFSCPPPYSFVVCEQPESNSSSVYINESVEPILMTLSARTDISFLAK